MSSIPTPQQAIDEALQQAISTPEVIKGDAGEVNNRSIFQLIQYDKHLAAKAAGKKRVPFGITFGRIVPPGANG